MPSPNPSGMSALSAPFTLDLRLEADTWPVADLPLCRVLLARNAAWPWLILVPRHVGLAEITDLPPPDRATLWQEVEKASAALQALCQPHKINIAALGNIVRQLHVHVVARQEGDKGWPGPIWGSGFSDTYTEGKKEEVLTALRAALL